MLWWRFVLNIQSKVQQTIKEIKIWQLNQAQVEGSRRRTFSVVEPPALFIFQGVKKKNP